MPKHSLQQVLHHTGRDGRSFVHGSAHALPAIASEAGLLRELPWDMWGSLAHVDDTAPTSWQFADARWLAARGLYEERLAPEAWIGEAVRRARRTGDVEVIGWPQNWILSLACARAFPSPSQ